MNNSCSRSLVFKLLTVASVFVLANTSTGMADDAALKAELDASYEQLLKDPSNKNLNLNYASVAMRMKDYEAAISPLERVLMVEPENVKIRFQVGVLYRALGSNVIAKEYFRDVVAHEGASPAMVDEAKGYLNAI